MGLLDEIMRYAIKRGFGPKVSADSDSKRVQYFISRLMSSFNTIRMKCIVFASEASVQAFGRPFSPSGGLAGPPTSC